MWGSTVIFLCRICSDSEKQEGERGHKHFGLGSVTIIPNVLPYSAHMLLHFQASF